MKHAVTAIILLFFLVGCSSSDESNATSKIEPMPEQEENKEDEFIKATIETSEDLHKSVENLEYLLANMNVSDSGWRFDVRMVADDIMVSTDTYGFSTYSLSEDQTENKYAGTIASYEQGIREMDSIEKDIRTAVDTYDKRLFQNIADRLDPAIQKLDKGIEHLEEERYE
jgi:major membrane immunogen (membrane-anchored lipoprotein)